MANIWREKYGMVYITCVTRYNNLMMNGMLFVFSFELENQILLSYIFQNMYSHNVFQGKINNFKICAKKKNV